MIEITDSCDKNQWDDFVYNHPYGNIFQTSDMADVYIHTKNYEPISLAAVDSNSGEILAVVQTVVMNEFSRLLGLISARAVIHGGPLYIKEKKGLEAVVKLMEHHDDIVGKKAIYSQIRNMWNTQEIRSLLEQSGYNYTEHFNALIELNKSIEELWNNLKRDKKRGIKKAEEMGLTIKICSIKSDIEIFYKLVKKTYDNAKIPLAHISLFKSTFDILIPAKKALFLFVKDGSENIIASQLALMYKNTIYAWYTGAARDFRKYHPGDYLIWYLLKYGTKHGYKTFDFGGGGSPNRNQNLREYKSRFGTEFLNYGRYKKTHSTIKSKIADVGFRIYQKLI